MNGGRVLGLDYGEKRIGLALSDLLGITAQPLCLLQRETDPGVIEEIGKLIEPNEVALVVVGLPVNLSGEDSPQTKRTRRFISKLRKNLSVKIIPWDERLSTSEADRALRDMEVKPSKRKNLRDIIAAQLILQGYLDQQGSRLEPRA